MFVKIGDFIKFNGFLAEFLENRRSWENQKPPENRQKSGLFWASPFTMHLVFTLLINYVWCSVIVYIKNGLWINYRRCNSGRRMPGFLPSAWNTTVTLHQLLGIHFWKCNVIIYIQYCFRIHYVIIPCPMVLVNISGRMGSRILFTMPSQQENTCAFFSFETWIRNAIHTRIRENFWGPSISN